MTVDRLLLSKLLEKGSDADLLKEMMQARRDVPLGPEARPSSAENLAVSPTPYA